MEATRAEVSRSRLLIPLGIALAVTVAIYIRATSLTPDPATSLFGQTAAGTLGLKSWLATAVLALALFQLYSALWLYGKILKRRGRPRLLGRMHRLSGAAAIVISLPIAYHCLFAYGFRDFDARTVVHSVAGCFFYGAFIAKVAIVRSKRLPGWALPLAGGTLFTVIVLLWYSTAVWYFNGYSLPVLGPSKGGGGSGYSAGGSYGGAGAAGAVPGAITMRNIQFAPRDITVRVGKTVRWTNEDAVDHNVVAQSGARFRSPTAFGKGHTYAHRFTQVGRVTYVCTLHPGMTGTVTVTG